MKNYLIELINNIFSDTLIVSKQLDINENNKNNNDFSLTDHYESKKLEADY